jgi:arylsulfatase A-like enzyme
MLRRISYLIVAVLFLSGCGRINKQAPERPNIVWLVLEDTSPYQFGCYGNTDVSTPEIDRMAEGGVRFTKAASNAPQCSPARSTLMTGCYATTYGMDIHREDYETPTGIFYPQFLREAGYFCTNNAKTDYNTTQDDVSFWDECHVGATYSSPDRQEGQPFFSIFNTTATHMGLVRTITTEGRPDLSEVGLDPNTIQLPPHVPDLPEVRLDEACMLNASQGASRWVQAHLDDLKAKGLADNTIVFFFSDHGGCLPRGKGLPYESGLSIPLVLHVPEKWQKELGVEPGSVDNRLVSFVDFAPTLLSLAGIEPPEFMQGKAFLGRYANKSIQLQFGFRSNQENYHFDPCRTVTDGRFKYIRNYIPHKPFCLRNLYQWGMPSNQAWDTYVMSRECKNEHWLQPFQPKATEMLFDLEMDPWELNNLALLPEYAADLKRLRVAVQNHIRETEDLGFVVRGIRKKPGGLYQHVKEGKLPMQEIYEAAELAGQAGKEDIDHLVSCLKSPYPEIRYWGAVGFCTLGSRGVLDRAPEILIQAANDPVDEVACAAAEAICYMGHFDTGIRRLIDLFKANFNLAYSSIETLSWYPDQKKELLRYKQQFEELAAREAQVNQDRMGLGVKVRSILVNLKAIPMSELYTKADYEEGIKKNLKGRQFLYPKDIARP